MAEPVLRAIAVAGLLGAAVVHASVVDAHLRERWLAGVVFLALQLIETALAFALVVRRSTGVCWTAIAASLAALALWAISPAGGAELVASACEIATACVLVPLVCLGAPPVSRARGVGRGAITAAVLAIGVINFAGNRIAATAYTVGQGAGHAHHGGPLRPGEYPLGAPLRKPTVARGAGFYFAAWPLRRVVLELGVGPDAKGINTFDVIVVNYAGRRIEVPDVRVIARLAGSHALPLSYRAARLSPGHFVVDIARLNREGKWLMHVEGRRSAHSRPLFEHTFAVQVGDGNLGSRGS